MTPDSRTRPYRAGSPVEDVAAARARLARSSRRIPRFWPAAPLPPRAWHRGVATPEQLARCEALESLPNRTSTEEAEWRTLRWAPDFADRDRALELATIDAAAPWPINMACNAAINAETKTWDSVALLAQCEALDVASLLVHGAQDPRPPFAINDLAQAIPTAQVSIIAEAGHSPWLERPGVVAAVLRPWLAKRA